MKKTYKTTILIFILIVLLTACEKNIGNDSGLGMKVELATEVSHGDKVDEIKTEVSQSEKKLMFIESPLKEVNLKKTIPNKRVTTYEISVVKDDHGNIDGRSVGISDLDFAKKYEEFTSRLSIVGAIEASKIADFTEVPSYTILKSDTDGRDTHFLIWTANNGVKIIYRDKTYFKIDEADGLALNDLITGVVPAK